MRHRRDRWVAAGLLLACLSAAGCSPSEATATDESGPSKVAPIKGSDRSQVVLTAEGAKRIGIKTEPVGATGAGTARQLVIPLAAVLYDNHGKTWTYTSPEPLTFVPKELVISRVEGDSAVLKSGPAPGTAVVTVGGAELLGAEYGVSGE